MTEHTYDWWYRARSGEKIGGPTLPVYEDAPQPGFYRRRFTEKRAMGEGKAEPGPFVPVAIFEHEGELIALVDGKRTEDPSKHWISCCRNPVSEMDYHNACSTGRWPDIAESVSESLTPPPAPGSVPGHNEPADETEVLKDRIETAKADLQKNYAEIKDDMQAARAQTLRATLLEIHRDADKRRATEKEPHLEAGKAVDARWMPIVKEAKAAADQLAKALSAFLTKKAKEEAEERRKFEEQQRKAEAEAAKAGKPAPEPAPAPKPAPVQSTIKGGHGRAATVKAVKVITDVTDWDALYAYVKGNPEVDAVVRKVAQQFVNAGNDVPGVTIEEQRKVA